LAYANRCPIAGASSLAAMALGAAELAPEGTLLVPLLDARKGEVYAGFYRMRQGRVEAAAPEAALSPQALLERLEPLGEALAFGEGYGAHRDALAAGLKALSSGPATPAAPALARLAAPRLFGAAFDAPALYALEPHYVRASEAEVKFPHGLGPGRTKS
jgi:tRNA threonylcarbamoyladenosine biosynthesis protein TsaB